MTNDVLLDRLSPSWLRKQYVEPFAIAREAFTPRFSTTASSIAMEEEVERFVEHMHTRRYTTNPNARWPRTEVLRDARVLLDELGGWRGAMHLVDTSGMRGLLDALTERLQARALEACLDGLAREIKVLSPADQLRLAVAYLDSFRPSFPEIELDHPALLMNRWRDVLHQHAHLALRHR